MSRERFKSFVKEKVEIKAFEYLIKKEKKKEHLIMQKES